ncbi:peptidoglycan-binding protein [Chloroflexales bacterium ZM16-3]|nr:peptidoglycan-binding protein [Chloroflexales bacterium ZM16-3]
MAGPAIPGGELVILGRDAAPLHSEPTCCEGAVWSADGSAVTIVGGGPGPDIRYGLFQIDAATGVEQTLIGQGDSSYPLVLGARQLLDGNTYAFYEEVPGDVFSWEYPFTSQMVRVDADGAITPLRQDSYPPSKVLWRDDASGALLTVWDMALDNPLAGSLVWADITGSPAIKTGVVGSNVLWADSVRPLYEGDCSLLPQVGWQPPEARTFSTGAADLQARLGAQGFDAGSPDGYFGDQTRAALRQFQTSRGIPPGDRLDCATWQALLGRP